MFEKFKSSQIISGKIVRSKSKAKITVQLSLPNKMTRI